MGAVEGVEVARGTSSRVLREAVQRLTKDLLDNPLAGVRPHAIGVCLRYLVQLAETRPGARAAERPEGDPALLRLLCERLRAEVARVGRELPHPHADEVFEVWERLEAAREGLFLHPPVFPRPEGAVQGPELVVELAHDLRSPLTSILFLCDALRRGQSGALNDLQYRQLGIVYSAAMGLASMASDVIDLAQGGERLLERQPAAFSVRELFDSLVDLVQPIAEERGLALRVSAPEQHKRLGHPVALSRVLLNLTTNALKFTEAGFVEITADPIGPGTVQFAVRDTGGGLDPVTVDGLYEPLRLKARRGEYGFSGSGLGLSICRRLVMEMGSELQFETISNWGTRFYFDLELPSAGTP